MGNFSNNSITDVGRMLLADVQAGAVFTPTRIVIGSGSMTGGATTQGMTDVITPVKSLAINKKKRTPDGKCVFGGVYTNEEVTEPFYFRELALYAKAVYLNEDGSVKSEGAETLYSYGNAGATADLMPAYSTSTVVEKQMDLVVWVGNDAQVDLTIESGIYLPRKEFDAHAKRHAAGGEDPITPESIGAAPDGFGLGKKGQHYYPFTENELNENLDHFLQTLTDGAVGFCVISDNSGDVLGGGTYGVYVFKHDNDYATAEFYGFIYDGARFSKAKWAGVWGGLRDTDPDAFAPSGYGLGGGAVEFDIKNIDNMKRNGWFYTYSANGYYIETYPIYYLHLRVDSWKDTPGESFVVQTLHNGMHRIRRFCINDVWGLWEWENPPMIPGVEYRTTERYNNAAVFKKVDANGNILWKTWSDPAWHLLSSVSSVSPATVE